VGANIEGLGSGDCARVPGHHGIVWEGRFHDGSVAESSSAQAHASGPEDAQSVYETGRRDERHMTMLRLVGFGGRLCWGAPLVFTTPNVVDTKHAMVKLLYEGEEVDAWRL
jgi:hypothetical protein